MSVIHSFLSTFIIQLFGAVMIFIRSAKRRKYFPIWAVIAVGGFFGMYFLPNVFRVGWFNFMFLIAFVVSMGLMWLCFDEKIIKILFFGVAAYAIQNFASALMFMIRDFAGISFGPSWEGLAVIVAVFSAVYTAGYFLLARKIKGGDILSTSRIPFLIVSAVTILMVMVLGLFSIQQGIGRNNAILFFRLIACAMALFIQFGLIEKDKTLSEKATIMHMLTEAERHSTIAKESMEFINIKCHDLKIQVGALKQINDRQAREESIEEIEKAILIFDAIAKTGNEALDIVLSEKSMQCQTRAIDFSYIADGMAMRFMNAVDIYLMMDNALENAIESVSSIEDKDRRIISMAIGVKANLLSIHLENFIEKPPIFENDNGKGHSGLPQTTKDDKQNHGFGLKSIRYIAQKYGGNMEVNIKDDRFVLDVLVPIRED